MKYMMLLLTIFLVASAALGQPGNDQESLIARILEVDKQQRDQIKNLVLTADYSKGEEDDQGKYVEKASFTKKVSIKYLADTALMHEDFINCWKEGKQQSDKDCQKAAEEDMEKKRRRATPNIAYPILRPFYASHRPLYNIEYRGVAGERVNEYLCHHFSVTAKEPSDTLINGDYYFDTESMHLVRVTFSPAKLVSRAMFKMSEMEMGLNYLPDASGFWLPTDFNFRMKAKAMWVINVPTVATERYSNFVVNAGVDDKLFEVSDAK